MKVQFIGGSEHGKTHEIREPLPPGYNFADPEPFDYSLLKEVSPLTKTFKISRYRLEYTINNWPYYVHESVKNETLNTNWSVQRIECLPTTYFSQHTYFVYNNREWRAPIRYKFQHPIITVIGIVKIKGVFYAFDWLDTDGPLYKAENS